MNPGDCPFLYSGEAFLQPGTSIIGHNGGMSKLWMCKILPHWKSTNKNAGAIFKPQIGTSANAVGDGDWPVLSGASSQYRNGHATNTRGQIQ
jgi:hypothetical protein